MTTKRLQPKQTRLCWARPAKTDILAGEVFFLGRTAAVMHCRLARFSSGGLLLESNRVGIPRDCTKVTCRCWHQQQQVLDPTNPDSWSSWSDSNWDEFWSWDNKWDPTTAKIFWIYSTNSGARIFMEKNEARGLTYDWVIPVSLVVCGLDAIPQAMVHTRTKASGRGDTFLILVG
jgi:hypothetical protein